MVACNPHWQDALSSALDGELAPTERVELDAHLAACAACADWCEQASRVQRAAFQLPQPDNSRRLIAVIEAKICACHDGGSCECTECACEDCTCHHVA